MSPSHPVSNSDENLRPQSSLAGSITGGSSSLYAFTPGSSTSVNINNSNMKLHRTITKTSSFQSLKQKFSTGSLFGRSKGSNNETALQALQGLFERPSRGNLREMEVKEAERERDKCDCVVPCLCDVLGKEIGENQANLNEGGGRLKQLIEQAAPRVGVGCEDPFLIDFDDKFKLDEGLAKVKEQKRPLLQIDTGIATVASSLAPPLQSENFRRQSTYEGQLMNTRTLRHKVGSVKPTQSLSKVSATNAEFIVPSRPPTSTLRPPLISTPYPMVEPTSGATTPCTPTSGYNYFTTASRRPELHARTTSVSSIFTNSTLSLTSYLSGTASTASSRPATPRSTIDRESAFANGYVSFPPYQGGGVSGVASYTSSFEDVGKWVGGVGRRLTRKIRKGSGAVGAEPQMQTEDKKLEEGTPVAEIRRKRGGKSAH
ncbi:hypothetical protein L211DRAFT_850344 [Terfezia boudieri ATCC MYA-4762]|uniref:Uncharacterized protein n=1 Tax=Terfezia boudieri ATCC MYA-4762 TaxID=1051890 RepID=A0A3N4LY12_9PEZI|nr:hypothetical protein L211DRAFT_850344 [Terfezia boudieri ATCC MYA-4762]